MTCAKYQDSGSPDVESERVQITVNNVRVVINNSDPSIALLYGEDLKILCTAANSSNLTIKRFKGKMYANNECEILKTRTLNESTISYYEAKPPMMKLLHICDHNDDIRNFASKNVFIVIIDKHPEITDFNCKPYNFEFINFTWTSENINPTISLSTVSYDGDIKLIYKLASRQIPDYIPFDERNPASTINYFYTWYTTAGDPKYTPTQKMLTFFMNICNRIACRNYTFEIEQLLVLQLAPPKDLVVFNKTSHSVVLKWVIPFRLFQAVEHKVEYRFSRGIYTKVNTTRNSLLFPNDYITHHYELKLPCAGKRYEVRVSVKCRESKIWSDYATIAFFTNKETPEIKEKEACKTKFQVPPVFKVYELTKQVDKEFPKLINKITKLKEKSGIIKQMLKMKNVKMP